LHQNQPGYVEERDSHRAERDSGLHDARIWGEAGTECTSNSKKVGTEDLNLMTE
jgi:hypothetical protein